MMESQVVEKSSLQLLEETCAMLGVAVTASGNKPFLLSDPEIFYLVRSGRVEIFAVQVRNGQPEKNRHHICTILPGEAFFGMDSALYGLGLGLLAVAQFNTELLEVPVAELARLAQESRFSEALTELLDSWLTKLSANVTKDTLPVRTEVLLEPETGVMVEARQKIGPKSKKDGLWIKFVEGEYLFLGEEDLSQPAGSYFPLYGNMWIQALESGKLATYSTGAVLTEPGLWQGLEQFYDLFFRVKQTNIQLVTYDEINRLRKKAEYDLTLGQEALGYLSSIVDGTKAAPTSATTTRPDPLLAACRLVGDAQGIAIQPPVESEEATARTNPLWEIARASRLRIRNVLLEEGWWRQENGPLLGFLKPDETPVALLPTASKAYEVVNPVDNNRVPLTREVADQLLDSAFVFYPPLPEKLRSGRDLLKFAFRGNRKDLWLVIALSAANGLLALFTPIATNFLFDTVIPTGQSIQLLPVLMGLVVAALATAAFIITRNIALLRIETRMDNVTQAAVWDRLLGLPTSFFRQYSVGDLAARATSIDGIRVLLGGVVIRSLLRSVFTLFSFFILFTYSLELGLVALVLLLVTLGVIIGVSVWQLRYQRSLLAAQGKVSSLVLQLLTGISKLRVAGAEVRAFAVWARRFSEQRKIAFRTRSIGNLLALFNAVWPIFTSLAIFGSVELFKPKGLTTGVFVAYATAFGQVLVAINLMASAFISFLQVIPLYERAKIILETPPEVDSAKADPGELSGSIEVSHLTFRYNPDGPYILNDVSLQIKPGQMVAIVGPSGSGKSSLFRLLLGFETAESGSIYYDNQDLAKLDIQGVRRRIGVVLQNGKLMPGDIYSNIVGSAPFTQAEAWEAARLVGFEQDIKQMPMGMFTLISEGGSTLSGGQRQRLMIARAIIAKPRILLFDEATSALDNQTQAIVSESLEKLQATRVVIAHRLSTVVNADCIYVLQGGKITQSGTYEELMSQEGLFRELATRQLA